jgi:hypothetical protein
VSISTGNFYGMWARLLALLVLFSLWEQSAADGVVVQPPNWWETSSDTVTDVMCMSTASDQPLSIQVSYGICKSKSCAMILVCLQSYLRKKSC